MEHLIPQFVQSDHVQLAEVQLVKILSYGFIICGVNQLMYIRRDKNKIFIIVPAA